MPAALVLVPSDPSPVSANLSPIRMDLVTLLANRVAMPSGVTHAHRLPVTHVAGSNLTETVTELPRTAREVRERQRRGLQIFFGNGRRVTSMTGSLADRTAKKQRRAP